MSYFSQADGDFILGTTDNIAGWMNEYAGRVTTALLNFQDEKKLKGSFLEIGVYAGKYLSLLHRASQLNGGSLVAIDPFDHFSPDQIRQNIGDPGHNQNIHFLKGFSSDFRSADVIMFLPGKAQFVSIDGSHDAVDVLEDLKLTYDLLHPKGVVAVDDFLNTECLGAVEAVCRFLDHKPGLIPFLFTSNKLFMAPAHAAASYYDFIDRFAAQDLANAQSARFAETRQRNKKWAQTEFYGNSVLVI